MKKLVVLFLCVLAVFTIVSCKNEPKPEPKPAKLVVTFDTQGGSAIDAVSVEKDATVTKPDDPSKDGATFYKWFKEATYENEYDFNTPVSESFTLYAKWVNLPAEEELIYKMTAGRESDRFQFQWIFSEAIKAGDVISFKYKSNRTMDKMTNREMSKADSAIEKLCSDAAISATLGEDGWYAFSYTIPEKDVKDADISANAKGIGIGLLFADGNSVIGKDYIYIKDLAYTSSGVTTALKLEDENRYSGAKGPIEKSFLRLVATVGGAPEGDSHNYDQDKFTLYWNPNVEVNPGDVFTITFKYKRNDPLTADRDFTYSIRDAKKWFSEKASDSAYPQGWSTFSEPDLEGWITATYIFPPADAATKEAITYPATFRVDFRDEYLASPAEGREADIVYIRSATITQPDPEKEGETITTALVLDTDRTEAKYACPTVEEFFFPEAE